MATPTISTVLLGSAITAAIGVGGFRLGIHDGVLFFGWLAIGVIYHIVFGSGLIARRRVAAQEDRLVAGSLAGTAAVSEAKRPLP
jgi:hypothetical protein